MLNIKIVYLYPNIKQICGESNLLRIIDFIKINNIYKINLINKIKGNIVNILKFKEESNVDKLIKLIKNNEN